MQLVRLALDIPEADRPALRYAAEELLRPLGAGPSETGEGPALYVGPSPPDGSVFLGDERSGPLRDVFRWLSGAMERETTDRDRLGRVVFASMPAAVQARPLATPVDRVRRGLAAALRDRGIRLEWTRWAGREWAICLTYDLDALRTRRLAALVGETARRRPFRGLRRGLGPDIRQRSAHALVALADRLGARATFFVKAGASGREDVPARPEREADWFRELRAQGHEVGLHPSIQAATDGKRLAAERDRLAAVLGERPVLVRSHFLRWEEAITPALFTQAGFRADSSLGWSASPGFRRGTAHPFRIWDPSLSAASMLWEVPLSVMDTTLFHHRGLSDDEAARSLSDVFRAAREAGGLAVVLWHNSMDADPSWWRRLEILETALHRAREEGAALLSLGEALDAAMDAI